MVSKPSVHTWSKVRLLIEACLVVVLTVLDIRDLNYKINWLGPYVSYRFAAVGPNVLQDVNLQLNVSLTTSGQKLRRPNGWSSFFDKCEKLSPVARAKAFRSAMGHNCTVGTPGANKTVSSLIMAGSVRVDSVAWACCQLLEPNRQPPVCNAPLVRGFEERYFMEPVPIPEDWFAQADSVEETELLGLLDVIGISSPLNHVTCVEGFEYLGPGQYYATLLGCGSPNYFRTAFAGYHATKLRELHNDKAYLTVDNINLMGFHYKIRENCISDWKVAMGSTGILGITHTTTINFSSYGQLYAFGIINDVILMVLNLVSALQLAAHLVVPAFRSKAPHARENFVREGYASYMTSTLYRSPMVIILIIISQLCSWLIIIPNSVMWTWGNSQTAKVQAYLSSVRTWTLILIIVNVVWDLFVFCYEKLAFLIAKHTFLTAIEIIAVGSYVSYYNRLKMFAISDAKYNVEHQRSTDATSFQKGYTGICNAYNPDLDSQLNTPTHVLWIVYKPLFTILLYSVLAIFGYAIAKFLLIYFTPFLARKVFKNEQLFVTATDIGQYAVSARGGDDDSTAREDDDDDGSSSPAKVGSGKTAVAPADAGNASNRTATRSFGTATLTKFGQAESSIAENAVTIPALPKGAHHKKTRGYARLPLEELLNNPIRARSLVRTVFPLDHIVNHDRFVAAQLYLEFGVFFVAGGRMKPRWGFLNPVPPIIQVNNTVISDMIDPLTPEQQLRRLRPATK